MRRSARRASSVLLAGLVCLAVGGCRRAAPQPGTGLVRIIDGLMPEGVLASPLQGRRLGEPSESLYPVHSSPLEGLGPGGNALDLKRSLKVGASEIEILFAPPSSEFAFDASLQEGAALEFGIGIVRDMNSEAFLAPTARESSGPASGVDFVVSLEVGGRRRIVFQKFLKLPPAHPERTFEYVQDRIALDPVSRPAKLILRTLGTAGAFSFWSSPMLLGRPGDRPNVVLISLDTLRPDHLGCYGYGRDTSPAIDELARDGILFEKAYASSPWTLPSHVSMLTGLHTVHHQVYSRDNRIDPRLPTLAERLRAASFYCAATTGGAFLDPMFGFSKGFDEYKVRARETDFGKTAADKFDPDLRRIEELAARRFFYFIHTYQTHSPYISPQPFNSMFIEPGARRASFDIKADLEDGWGIFRAFPEPDRRNIIGLYDGGIRTADETLVKEVVRRLRALGLYDRTLIVLTSDHGEQFYDHGSWNHGNFLYDDALRVPLIVKLPGSRHHGRRVETPVRLVDLVPTLLDELGVPVEKGAFDGESLLPLLDHPPASPRRVLADAIEENDDHGPGKVPRRVAVIEGGLKVIYDGGFRPDYYRLLTVRPPERKPVEVFDLVRDPGETRDISEANAEAIRRLRAEIEDMFRNAPPRQAKRSATSADAESRLKALGYVR